MTKLEFLKQTRTQKGDTLWDLSHLRPVLLVLLRHFGCVFCKEALTELGKIKGNIKDRNTHLVLVHLSDAETAESFLPRYGLEGIDYIADPDARIYEQLGLLKAELRQMMGLKVWLRTFHQGIIKGQGMTTQVIGDGFQMPGVFLLFEGEIKDKFIHHSIADKPDYLKLMECLECQSS